MGQTLAIIQRSGRLILALLLVYFIGLSAALAETGLLLWQALPNSPRIILPIAEQETPLMAVNRYLQHLKKPEIQSEISDRLLKKQFVHLEKIEFSLRRSKTITALLANNVTDMDPFGDRILRTKKVFEAAGAEVYVVALKADAGLSATQSEEFRTVLSEKIDLLVALGGNDVNPRLYNQEQTHAKDIDPEIDKSEFLLIQKFKSLAHGVFFGICRGHQLGAIVDGHELYQDITKDGIGETSSHINDRGAKLQERQLWHRITTLPSLLTRFMGQSTPLVNSLHHQAVKLNTDADSLPVAFHEGVIEALQAKNGLSLSVQFHPEFTKDMSGNESFSRMGFSLVRGIVAYARLIRANQASKSCNNIHL